MSPKLPWQLPPRIECHEGIQVLRDDELEGGTKVRVLPYLVKGAEEVVFGGPFCGGAPLALSAMAKYTGLRVTLFYAKRKRWHPRQRLARQNGARLVAVPMGWMSHVQAKARAYAQRKGALFLPLGYDMPAAEPVMAELMHDLRRRAQGFDHIYVACSSGMLTRCIAQGFPETEVIGVCVGLKSRWQAQAFPSNVRLVEWPRPLATPVRGLVAPFPCCPFYELKAWSVLQRERPKGRTLFWNVLGDPT